MELTRTQEFEEGCGILDDGYVEHSNLANKIMRTFGTKVFVPLLPTAKIKLSKENIDAIKKDTTADTIFICDEFEAEGYEIVYTKVTTENLWVMRVKETKIYAMPKNIAGKTLNFCIYTKEEVAVEKEKLQMEEIKNYIKQEDTLNLNGLKEKVENAKFQMEDYRKHLVSTIKQYNKCQEEYETAKEKNISEEKRTEEIISALEELRADGKLSSIKFDNDNVIYTTNLISITDENKNIRPIGEFVVTLNINKASVNIMNTDNKINKDSWCEKNSGDSVPQHPHVGNDGTPCLGSMAEVLADICAVKDIAAAWQIIYSYLSSYNQNDVWGRRLKYWATECGDFPPIKGDKDGVVECTSCSCDIDTECDDFSYCDDCGEPVCDGCSTWSDNSIYCDKCKDDHWNSVEEKYEDMNVEIITCPNCGATFTENSEEIYEGESGDLYCCPDCAEKAEDLREEDMPDDEDDE